MFKLWRIDTIALKCIAQQHKITTNLQFQKFEQSTYRFRTYIISTLQFIKLQKNKDYFEEASILCHDKKKCYYMIK